MAFDLSRHPCFNDKARVQYGRIHLPVAPQCNIQCNFCNRRCDCVNESRPGVTSSVLSPGQALAYLDEVMARDPRISVVGIAGPGDPMANAGATLETLRLVRAKYPEMLLCVASNGLNVAEHADELAELQVSHVTITINAVDPTIGAKVYAWARDGKKVFRGEEGAQRLLDRQLEAVRALKARDVAVKVNTILIPGVNDEHVEAVARTMADLGADILNCVPMYPVEDTPFAVLGSPSAEMIASARARAGEYLPQMHHCTRCRADACGLLSEGTSDETFDLLAKAAAAPLNPQEERPHVAVASLEGVLVNQHLGEADRLWVFTRKGEAYELVDTRSTPAPGGGRQRWEQLAEVCHDCRAVLTSGAGDAPRSALTDSGVAVHVTEGLIEERLGAVYAGEALPGPAGPHRCGVGCTGNGTGCG